MCVCVCQCMCVSVCVFLFFYPGGDFDLNTHRLMGTRVTGKAPQAPPKQCLDTPHAFFSKSP